MREEKGLQVLKMSSQKWNGEKNAGLSAVIHREQNALKILRSNTIQWQSEIIGCNRANIFNRNETQDISPWLRGVHLFVRLWDAFKSDRYLMSSFILEHCSPRIVWTKGRIFCLLGQSSARQSALIDFFVSRFYWDWRLESDSDQGGPGRVGHWTWHVIWHLHVMHDTLSWHFMTCNLLIGFTWPSTSRIYPWSIFLLISQLLAEKRPLDLRVKLTKFADPSPDMWHFYS